jgi:cyclopropane fatty-acyl-phospholipid synthase-like methyltransferase
MSLEACLVCGGTYAPSRLAGLRHCTQCGFITADVNLTRTQLEQLYTARYFTGEEYRDYVSERPTIEKHFRVRIKRLLRYVTDAREKRLFEIGCAYGFFLSVAREHFGSVAGIDLSADAATYAAETLGLSVHVGDFDDYEFPEPPNVICLWDTIEHLAHPGRYLKKIAYNMQPGGIVALTTGDIGSLVARLRGARWRQIHPPTHLHYFSKATLCRLLERYGYAVRYCGYDGMHRSVDTMAYMILSLRHNRPRLYQKLQRTGLLNWSIYLNLYDILFVIAEKKS